MLRSKRFYVLTLVSWLLGTLLMLYIAYNDDLAAAWPPDPDALGFCALQGTAAGIPILIMLAMLTDPNF
jgi:hypothetical protein